MLRQLTRCFVVSGLPTTRSEASLTVAFKRKTSTTPSIMRFRASSKRVIMCLNVE